MNDCVKRIRNFSSTNFGFVLYVQMFIWTCADIYTYIHLCVYMYKLHSHQYKYIKCERINICMHVREKIKHFQAF